MLMCSVQLRHLEMYMPQWCDYRELMLVSIALAILSYSTEQYIQLTSHSYYKQPLPTQKGIQVPKVPHYAPVGEGKSEPHSRI
jgi:hypothetical protein